MAKEAASAVSARRGVKKAGVLGALAGIMGSLMALEVVRAIVPFGESLVGRLLMVDAQAMRFETLAYAWDPENTLNGLPSPGWERGRG